MRIAFELDDHETKVTPMKVVDALVDSNLFTHKELREIIAYLSVFTKYNNLPNK